MAVACISREDELVRYKTVVIYEPTARAHMVVVFAVLGTVEVTAELLCGLNVFHLNHCFVWLQRLMAMKAHDVDDIDEIML